MRATRPTVFIAAIAMATTACSGSVSIGGIDQGDVESEVVRVLEEGLPGEGGASTADFSPWEADCSGTPSTLETGDSFSCTATSEELELPITVTAEDDEGNVTISVE
jgi:hypothetical protein